MSVWECELMSRELTIAWANRNCPDPRVVKDVALRLDEAAAAGGHLLLVVGKRLTRSRTPYLVISHRREMFAFELTSKQAKNLESRPDALGAFVRRRLDEVEATAPEDPAVMLTNLVIDGADKLDPAAPVTGHLEYQSSSPRPAGVAVRLMYDVSGRATVSHFDHPLGYLPASGTLRFRFSPLKAADRDLPRTLPVFVSLCLPAVGTAPHVPISNTCAGLIDLA